MKPEESSRDDTLSNLLQSWKPDASLPPRFGEQVWRRIPKRETPATRLPPLLRDWIGHLFSRPAFALSYVTVLLAAGLTTGLWQAHLNSERSAAALGTRYVQMMDPFQMPGH
jgi:hypothetical protein